MLSSPTVSNTSEKHNGQTVYHITRLKCLCELSVDTCVSGPVVGQHPLGHHGAAVHAHPLGLAVQVIVHDVGGAAARAACYRGGHLSDELPPCAVKMETSLSVCTLAAQQWTRFTNGGHCNQLFNKPGPLKICPG